MLWVPVVRRACGGVIGDTLRRGTCQPSISRRYACMQAVALAFRGACCAAHAWLELTMVGIAEAIHANDARPAARATRAARAAASTTASARGLPAAVLCLRRRRDQRV
jgi:hypothetical protein